MVILSKGVSAPCQNPASYCIYCRLQFENERSLRQHMSHTLACRDAERAGHVMEKPCVSDKVPSTDTRSSDGSAPSERQEVSEQEWGIEGILQDGPGALASPEPSLDSTATRGDLPPVIGEADIEARVLWDKIKLLDEQNYDSESDEELEPHSKKPKRHGDTTFAWKDDRNLKINKESSALMPFLRMLPYNAGNELIKIVGHPLWNPVKLQYSSVQEAVQLAETFHGQVSSCLASIYVYNIIK